LLLLLLGLVMSFSASFVPAAEAGDPFAVFRRQAVWAVIGARAFVLAARLDHRIWRGLAWPLLVLAVLGLALLLVPAWGDPLRLDALARDRAAVDPTLGAGQARPCCGWPTCWSASDPATGCPTPPSTC
jgi:hypothetical protein